MLIVILSIIALAIGIAFLIYYNHSYGDWPLAIGLPLAFTGGVALICSLVIICCVHIPKDANYENNAERREMLVYRLEHQEEGLVGNELLYQEIRDFNEDLRYHKKYCDSPWLGWFFNERNATFDYIDYRKGE